jgi:hypothetical protein
MIEYKAPNRPSEFDLEMRSIIFLSGTIDLGKCISSIYKYKNDINRIGFSSICSF